MTEMNDATAGALCRLQDLVTDCERDIMGICAAIFSKIGNAKSWVYQYGADELALGEVLKTAGEVSNLCHSARSDIDGVEEELNALHEKLGELWRT